MKNLFFKVTVFTFALVVGLTGEVFTNEVFADDGDEGGSAGSAVEMATSISISPVSKVLQLEEDKIYEDSFSITNNGSNDLEFEVYAAPYSYTFSENDNAYKLGFSNENAYTQITRWITFKDSNGNFVKNPHFVVAPNSSVDVVYRISTPSSVPDGGQYAVLFAHTIADHANSSGIKTEASPGLVIYGRSVGETKLSGEISNMEIKQTIEKNGAVTENINAAASVKNNGNVDFMASGELVVTGLFGIKLYETPNTKAKVSIIPETELMVADEWEETPYFGLFNVSWTVMSAGGESQTIYKTILLLPLPIVVLIILLLTFITIWIIVIVRKRKERRSRYSM